MRYRSRSLVGDVGLTHMVRIESRKLTRARGHASRSTGQAPRVPREQTRGANSKIQVLSGMLRRNTNLLASVTGGIFWPVTSIVWARLSLPSSRNREISTATPRRRGSGERPREKLAAAPTSFTMLANPLQPRCVLLSSTAGCVFAPQKP